MEFRKDINGLRAIAVTAVVLYHFGVRPFQGGFVGVDVFFVISGFLLTSIAYRDLQAGVFSPWSFLLKRLRRIFPAMAVMIIACLAWAGYFYLPPDYKHFARVAASAFIVRSNFIFEGDAGGYFAPDARQEILLHTWSLSLESQFYLVFAALCGVFWSRSATSRRMRGAVLFAALALASVAWCVIRTGTDQPSAFYLLWSRAWEFMAGGAVAVYGSSGRSPMTNNALAVLGALLLAACIVGMGGAQPYPGWRALLPVAGAALVILSPGGVVSRVLSTNGAQFVGNISYSVYLWHWPLLLAFRERTGHDPSGIQVTALVLMTIAVGWLSYRFVEQPTRRYVGNRRLLIASLTCLAGVFTFSGVVSATDGWPQRLPGYLQPAAFAMIDGNPRGWECSRTVDGIKETPGDFCVIGAKARHAQPTMILWGDSFAERLQPSVEDIASRLDITGIVATEGGCPPFRGKVFKGSGAEIFRGCERYSNFVFDYVSHTPAITLAVIAGDWQRYDGTYEGGVIKQIAQILARRGGHVVFVSAVPNPRGDIPHEWAREQFQAGHAIREQTVPRSGEADIIARGAQIASIASKVGNVIVVDPFASLCSSTACFTVKDDHSLYSDTDHLSETGVRFFAPSLSDAIARAQLASKANIN